MNSSNNETSLLSIITSSSTVTLKFIKEQLENDTSSQYLITPLVIGGGDEDHAEEFQDHVSSYNSTPSAAADSAPSTTTIKPDIIVGFVFLGLSALLLLTIIIVCIYVQRPFKQCVRYYRHYQRKQIMLKMGVDEIHDLQYDAGFIPKPTKQSRASVFLQNSGSMQPAPRRQRLISQHFDQIIDLEPDQSHPYHNFVHQHAMRLAAKRLSMKHRWGGRWSQGERASLNEDEAEYVHRNSSLPVFDDNASLPARESVETTTLTVTTADTFPEQTGKKASKVTRNHLLRQLHQKQTSENDHHRIVKTDEEDEAEEDEVVARVSLSSATMGVESVSKNTPQSKVLQEMIAKSRASAAKPRASIQADQPLLQAPPRESEASRRRSTVTSSRPPLQHQPASLNSEQQQVGRFRVQSIDHRARPPFKTTHSADTGMHHPMDDKATPPPRNESSISMQNEIKH